MLHLSILQIVLLTVASFAAGITNAIAGGGSFLMLTALLLTGLDPRAANMTSTIALFPTQVATGFVGRKMAGGTPKLSLRALFVISLLGGAVGAALLLQTPPAFFARLVPWLILIATGLFAYGSFRKKPDGQSSQHHMGRWGSILSQIGISIYGGYFGGGIGFLMLAALTLAGTTIRAANATKNILAGVMNTAAVLVFVFSPDIGWTQALVGAVASSLGGQVGVRLIYKVNERILRMIVITIGTLLTIALFARQ